MAEPIIFTLLLGGNNQILEKISKETVLDPPTIVSLQTNKESSIPDKERIFAEILKESREQNKSPIFNVQLSNNNTAPIFKSQDLINLQNLNIKSTITFEHYNSLAENPALAAYWKELFTKTSHVFFANEQDKELAINENTINRGKATTITDIDSVLSVFNNLADDKKVNKLLSGAIPDKAELDKLIKTTKNQGGRVIVKTWPLSSDQAANLITAKFGITSEDQIYGLKLEITEILKDPNNAAENLKKYVFQISRQFQKDLGKSEVNPIDFNFDREQIMKNIPDNTKKEPTISYETKQPEQPSFFRRVFNYFKSVITSYFGTKEEAQPPQQQPTTKTEAELIKLPKEQIQEKTMPTQQQSAQQINANSPQKDWKKVGMTEQAYKAMMSDNTPALPSRTNNDFNINDFKYEISTQDINNVKTPNYWYTENEITHLLTAQLDEKKFSVQPAITFRNTALTEEMLKDYTAKGEEKKEILAKVQETIELANLIPDKEERTLMLGDAKKREEILNLSDAEREKLKNDLTRGGEAQQQINEDILNRATQDIKDNGKEAAVIPVEMGYGHWTVLVAKYDKKDNQITLTFNDSLGNSINYDGQKLPKLIDKTLGNLPNKPIIIDEQTKQQNNQSDCGVFTVDNGVKIAKEQEILSTEQSKGEKGLRLRERHAEILTDAMFKQDAQWLGQQIKTNKNAPDTTFQDMIKSQKTRDSSIRR
ncbi:hypothetical protein BA173_02295 [Rickettsia sp. MEAM1 (Bemisia tabaci)]|uniref:hypothetical protein n=1 Tax=unclassified Rickettsia TaxID=114295 RepID=UPI00082D3308|nr:hypothetical protein BA173_02295 [Rickettsia sp. MEAM1 (Bemisia tabaci)]ODA37017.1 hypothetical protein A8V33_03445 [Rickettsia sp. wb]ODA37743.1 hypothetical protein A8V34_00245 [Rickettsia sp. wq]